MYDSVNITSDQTPGINRKNGRRLSGNLPFQRNSLALRTAKPAPLSAERLALHFELKISTQNFNCINAIFTSAQIYLEHFVQNCALQKPCTPP